MRPGASDSADELLATAKVAAAASLSCRLAEVDALRTGPGVPAGSPIAKALRNADEQTVVAVCAMLRAIDAAGWGERSFAEWGVIGGPRYLGRMLISGLLTRYFEDSKFSISPHVIPNYSLHATSGTASVGLGLHGPNFGVGGGPGNAPEGLLTGLSVLGEGRLPGVWLLLSEFDPEPIPDRAGKATNEVVAYAAALALTADAAVDASLSLRRVEPAPPAASVRSLVEHIGRRAANRWTCGLAGLGELRLELEPNQMIA